MSLKVAVPLALDSTIFLLRSYNNSSSFCDRNQTTDDDDDDKYQQADQQICLPGLAGQAARCRL